MKFRLNLEDLAKGQGTLDSSQIISPWVSYQFARLINYVVREI